MTISRIESDSNQPGKRCHHKEEGKKPVIIDGKQFTPEEYLRMVERRRNGDRTVDIANDKGVSRKSLDQKFRQQKIHAQVERPREFVKIGNKLFSTIEATDLIERRQAGETVNKIASEVGISKGALRFFFDTNKIMVDTKEGFTWIGRQMYSKEIIESLIERRKQGESIDVVAHDIGVESTTLRRFFDERNVKPEVDLKIKRPIEHHKHAFNRKDVLQGSLPKEIQEKIIRMKKEGKTNREIGRSFNLGEQDLGKYFSKNLELVTNMGSVKIGVDLHAREDVEMMIEARKGGDTVKSIALNNGVKEYSLGRFFQKNKIKPDFTEGTIIFGRKFVSKERMDDIRRRRMNGVAIQKLADELGLHISTLERFFLKNQVIVDDAVKRDMNRKYKIDHDFFKQIDSSTKAYLLGLIMTDGNIHKEHNSLRFDFQKRDKILCEIARKSLNSNAIIVERCVKKCGPQVRIQFNSKKMINDLARLGVEPSVKTYNNKFPSESVVPRQFQRDFIRGVVDGDGSATISYRNGVNTRYATYSIQLSGTMNMVRGVQQVLVRDAGLKENKIFKDTRTINNHAMIYFGTGNVARVFEYLYPPGFDPDSTCLKRKHDRMKEAHDKWNVRQSRR